MKKLSAISVNTVPAVKEYIDPNIILKIPQEVNRQRNCVFCDIAHGEDPKTDLLYKDDNFVAFRNITPAASHHYLVIPKDHIRDAVKLKPYHIPMLYQMEAIAAEVLKQQGAVSMTTRIGYHWPPFISIPHLHLHVIAPEEELSMKSRIIFQPSTRWFLTTKEIVVKINSRHLVSSL
ncbi:histidine triad nucleotide-binding protein 3 [Nephila pilipes]|uniref:Adenosine 5'-monophosphoramidase HINT3 n=1 Tax=Nephila pilipes TaxID=299642 RepID=A0A8X6T783_NEPPI|nr:histidine triad nucleotide-binding protein 3 [Nephila pilipes]